jgi:hypothetical protein
VQPLLKILVTKIENLDNLKKGEKKIRTNDEVRKEVLDQNGGSVRRLQLEVNGYSRFTSDFSGEFRSDCSSTSNHYDNQKEVSFNFELGKLETGKKKLGSNRDGCRFHICPSRYKKYLDECVNNVRLSLSTVVEYGSA